MNGYFKSITIVGVSLGSMFVVGCGEDDSGLTAAEFREQANAICVVGDQEIGAAVGSVFGAESPTPEDMQAALDTIVSVSNRQLDDIEALGAPGDLKDDVDALLSEGRSANSQAESEGLGFFESDGDPWEETSRLAGELGLDGCTGE